MNISLLERSALGKTWEPRAACITTLTLVFLVGAAVGAVAMNFGHSRLHHPAFDVQAGRTLYFERLQKELDLSPSQAEQLQSILGDFWQYYRTVLSDSKARVEQVLNQEQRKKFERLLQEAQQK